MAQIYQVTHEVSVDHPSYGGFVQANRVTFHASPEGAAQALLSPEEEGMKQAGPTEYDEPLAANVIDYLAGMDPIGEFPLTIEWTNPPVRTVSYLRSSVRPHKLHA